MSDTPWLGDACSLVEAFRAGERAPTEEVELVLGAIERSELNAFAHVDPERARREAAAADPAAPFGGVPVGVKMLDDVEGWPATEASLVFAERVATHTSTMVQRLVDHGGVALVGQCTASEFGGLNVSTNRLTGTTHNPWQIGRTAGGSSPPLEYSKGSACSVARIAVVSFAWRSANARNTPSRDVRKATACQGPPTLRRSNTHDRPPSRSRSHVRRSSA